MLIDDELRCEYCHNLINPETDEYIVSASYDRHYCNLDCLDADELADAKVRQAEAAYDFEKGN